MVDNNEQSNDQKVKSRKATKGAWWKSTVNDREPINANAPAETTKNTLEGKAGEQVKKKKPRLNNKLSVGSAQQGVDQETFDARIYQHDIPAEISEEKQEKTKPYTEAQSIMVSLPVVDQSSLEGTDNSVFDSTVAEASEIAKSEVKKGRSNRGRRGRRGSKKSQPVVLEDGSNSSEDKANNEEKAERELNMLSNDIASTSEIEEEFSAEESLFDEQEILEQFEESRSEETKRVCKLLINAEEPEECRLALLEDGRLESLHVSTISRTQTKNNIYKAKIVAIEPSLQAAFVDYGREKNGFLPFSEIHPEYYRENLSDELKHLVATHQWKKLNITEVIEKGQEILAQVVKEEVGKKGANMTTYLSIPGRSVVLMPGSDSSGISRKISGEEKRSQLRGAMDSIDLPEGIGWIVRTASIDINEEDLSRDVKYLMTLWEEIKKKGQEMQGVGLIYEDQESILRFLREHFDPAIKEILVDDRAALEQVKSFVSMLPEEQRQVKVRLHQGARPIFNLYSVEDQIESIYQPQVNLPSGGSIVINPTEALVAIDVNSGSTSKGKNFEASIFQANMEAAVELARQLRLRDLGGLIVVDFIDMRNRKNIMAVEKKVKESMKKDKAKVDFSRISKFGLMQISRQKLGAPIEAGNYRQCEFCKGRGTVRSIETLSLFYLRRIQTGASRKGVKVIECRFPIDVASYLLNNKREELYEMEKRYDVMVIITALPDMKPMEHDIVFQRMEKEGKEKKQA